MQRHKTLDSNMIKVIAIIAMTVDHVAWAVSPGYPKEPLPIVMHIIGRSACPIMCYFIAEGYHYTKNIDAYTFRLFAFAIVSHFAYSFASMDFVDARSFIPFYYGDILNQTSVMWSLAWGLVMLRIANSDRIKKGVWKAALIVLICFISFPSDWSCIAALCILAFGTNRGDFKKQMLWMVSYAAIYAMVYSFAIDEVYGWIQMFVVLSIPVLSLYNGERGKDRFVHRSMKWLFYIYYPLHLVVIGWIRTMR